MEAIGPNRPELIAMYKTIFVRHAILTVTLIGKTPLIVKRWRPGSRDCSHHGEWIMKKPIETQHAKELLKIAPLRQAILTVPLIGETPLKVLRFSKKQQDEIMATQKAGSQATTKKKREPKDFERNYQEAMYRGKTGKEEWLGINASGLRIGCIEACRVAGFVMTRAKMSVFCMADGIDIIDHSTPLVRVYGTPEMCIDPVRNDNGSVDLRARVCFQEWRINARIRFDEDQFSPSDILNLLIRVGMQNGLGEGRMNSKNGCGTGNGVFLVDADNCNLERLPVKPITFEK